MAIFYYYQLSNDITEARDLKNRTYNSLQPFYQYLDKTRRALENRTVTASWERVGGNRIRLNPISLFYRITPVTNIKLTESKNWFLVNQIQGLLKNKWVKKRHNTTRTKYFLSKPPFWVRGFGKKIFYRQEKVLI